MLPLYSRSLRTAYPIRCCDQISPISDLRTSRDGQHPLAVDREEGILGWHEQGNPGVVVLALLRCRTSPVDLQREALALASDVRHKAGDGGPVLCYVLKGLLSSNSFMRRLADTGVFRVCWAHQPHDSTCQCSAPSAATNGLACPCECATTRSRMAREQATKNSLASRCW